MDPRAVWGKLGGQGEPPTCLGSERGRAIVMGGGRSVWDDLQAAGGRSDDVPKVAVNDVGAHWHGRVEHWLTLHPEYFPGWWGYRKRHGYGDSFPVMRHATHTLPGIVDVVWHLGTFGGTSGLAAVYLALLLGYEQVTLCGVPLDNLGHYFDPPWVTSDFAGDAMRQEWHWARDRIFEGRVKSMSGRTREWLGAP